MKQPVKMPALSDTMESGRLVRWMKQPGDAVARGDVLAEVETDKALMDMEAFASGVLVGPLVAEDQEYPVGETLAWIGEKGAEQPGVEKGPPAKKAERQAEAKEARVAAGRESPKREAKNEPAPAAKSASEVTAKAGAQEFGASRSGAETAAVSGETTPVLKQALAARPEVRRQTDDADATLLKELVAGPPYKIAAPARLRQVIATTVNQAVHTPQFRISTQLDLAAFKAYAEERDWSFTLLLAKACALTIHDYPDFNAAWTRDGLARRERVDVAIAMEAEHGLLTPVVRDVAGRTLAELVEDWNALKDKIKQHRLAPEAYRGGTFYLSNLGMFPGVMQFDAIVPPGATAILAVAAPGEQGTVLTLTCDHRVVFGADAARFLASLAQRLADPASWAA